MDRLRDKALRKLAGLEAFPQPPLIRTRYPVVLMHGFGALAGMMRGGHLHEEALHLRLHGVIAYAPNVTSYNTVEARAAMWEERLQHILDETGAERLNLVAQSMGGLDARYLIHEKGFHETVATLVTVSTPHRGTAIAELLLDQPALFQRLGADLADWLGEAMLEDGHSNTRRALEELTPAYVADVFNPATPDHPDVQYWSFAGAAGKGTTIPVNPFMKVGNVLLYEREGLNDGLVSVESAKWGRFLGTFEADHAQQVGLNALSTATFDADAFYCDLARRLGDAGF